MNIKTGKGDNVWEAFEDAKLDVKLARKTEVIELPPVEAVGKVVRRARKAADLPLKALAYSVDRTAGWVSDLEHGRIKKLKPELARVLDSELGLSGYLMACAAGTLTVEALEAFYSALDEKPAGKVYAWQQPGCPGDQWFFLLK
ncbi:MAG: multiprotein-bridging factor 1 family protein [Phycisphaerales bacterium JB052]